MTSLQNKGAWLTAKQARSFKIDDAPIPKLDEHQVLVRTKAVAINPVDVGVQKLGLIVPEDGYPVIIGWDLAGDVVSVGSAVTAFKPGDRVAGCASAAAFQLYVVCSDRLMAKLPDNVSYTQGSILPLCLSTAALSLFQQDTLALPLPSLDPKPNGQVVLVWGGASVVGACGIQLIKAAGFEVAATAGAHNAQFCRDLGADYVFDYKKENVIDEIVSALTGKPFAGVFAAVFGPGAIDSSAQVASQLGGRKFVATVLPAHMPHPEPVPEGVTLGYCWGVSLADNEVGPHIWGRWLTPALEEGLMRCRPEPTVVGHGLESIQVAVDQMAKGVSAKKIVVEIA